MPSPWINSALLLALSALGAGAVLCHQTPDLSGVALMPGPKEAPLRDLPDQLEQTAIKQSAPLEISEGELNDYLARRLRGTPNGMSRRFASFDRVLIELSEGVARVHLCWNVMGHQEVARVDVSIQRTDRDFTVQLLQGAYGRLEVPRAMLTPLIPALNELARACRPEIQALFKLPHIKLTKDKVVLNPKF